MSMACPNIRLICFPSPEGVNGVLPNLDLVNVIVYLCHSEKVMPAFHSKVDGVGWDGRWVGRVGGRQVGVPGIVMGVAMPSCDLLISHAPLM